MKFDGFMMGYYKNFEKIEEVIVDGFYWIGDLGRIDENGNVWIIGCLGDVFKMFKGKFIYLKDVENYFDDIEELE